MPRYRVNWREPAKYLPGTLPNGWSYRCLDLVSESRDTALETARELVPVTGELLGVIDLAELAAEPSPALATVSVASEARSKPTPAGPRPTTARAAWAWLPLPAPVPQPAREEERPYAPSPEPPRER
jgi:hypothetical protein